MRTARLLLCALLGGALTGCFLTGEAGTPARGLKLHGNVDDRELSLSFLVSERLESVLPEEGQAVAKGDLLATLESVRLERDLAVAEAGASVREAELEVARAALLKARNGSRPEDIAENRAMMTAVEAKIRGARLVYERKQKVLDIQAIAPADVEVAEADFAFYTALLGVLQERLEKLENGERPEDVAGAGARVAAATAALSEARAQVAVLQRRLEDLKLYAPCSGIVRRRLLEPGEIASPQQPVLLLAATDPKWVRCYLSETELSRVKLGDAAKIALDGRQAPFEGWVGYISPSAEFTPKYIETDALRPTLVYETRIYVKDPAGELKLGAPVTVTLER